METSNDIREFLTSRRAKVTPDQAGLPAYGARRRVTGLRREETAMLAGISVEYYTRLERGDANGASEDVLEGIARALQLDEAERAHLFDLVRSANRGRPTRSRPSQERVRPTVERIIDAMTGVPAYVRNGRLDILAANPLGHALYSPVFSDLTGTANMTRFIFLHPQAAEFFPGWEQIANDAVAILRAEAGRDPYDRRLSDLIGELSTRSDQFRVRWAAHNVKFHRAGTKTLHHPLSATSPSRTKHSTCPVTAANASSSTPRSPDPHHKRPSTSSPVGPQLRQAAPSSTVAFPDPGPCRSTDQNQGMPPRVDRRHLSIKAGLLLHDDRSYLNPTDQDMETITLNNGVEMPALGLGVFQTPPDETRDAVAAALGAGYRHIDTAAAYGNERPVGEAVHASGLDRSEVFLETKIWISDYGYDETLHGYEKSARKLGVDQIDLLILHQALPSAFEKTLDAYRALEALLAGDKVRAIGVSNFMVEHLTRLLKKTTVVPAVNQIECHPYFAQREVQDFGDEHGIVTQAWSPIGGITFYRDGSHGSTLDDPVITGIARAQGKSPAQVMLRWGLQQGRSVIPKSTKPSRIAENIDVFDFQLTSDEIAAIDSLDTGKRGGPEPEAITLEAFGRDIPEA